MVIVCAMNDSGRLTVFIARPDTHCDIDLCATRLRDLGCPHVRSDSKVREAWRIALLTIEFTVLFPLYA